MGGAFWWPWGMSGKEIYDNFQNGQGPERLSAAADTVKALIANYENRADSIKALTERMESAWQGDASGAAQRGAGPLAVEHGLAAPEMNTAQSLVRSQVDVFNASKTAVVPIPPQPEKPGFWDNVISLGDAGRSYEDKLAQYNAANDHNVTVMSSYEDVTGTNTSRMPTSYGSITPDYAGIGVVEQKPPPPPGPPQPRDPRQPGGDSPRQPPGTRDPGQVPGQPQQPRPGEPVGPGRPAVPPTGPGQTDPGQYVPPGPTPGPGQNPGQGSGYGPGPGFGPGYPPGGFGPTGVGGGGADAGRGGAAARGPGGGAAGGFAEEGKPSARGGAPGAGAAAAEAAAARGAGAGGRGGMGGMPMGGGGARGQGGEDAEHQRLAFLIEADPDETFGTDEVTAPPVIGE